MGGPGATGTAYKLKRNGAFAVVFTFTDPITGTEPRPLTLGSDGNFYGTSATPTHGNNYMNGSTFPLGPSGTLTTIARFSPNDPIRDDPNGQLAIGPDGAFYGVTGAKHHLPTHDVLHSQARCRP